MISLADLIFLLVIVVGILYIYFNNCFKYWAFKGVPCKRPIIPFGNLLEIILSRESAGKALARLYSEIDGPYFGFYVFAKPFLVLKDPNIIKTVLIKDFHIFPNRAFFVDENIDPIVSNALFGIKVPHWKALRSKLSPVFTSGKMKMMLYLMKQCGENLKSYVETLTDKNVEMKELAAKYTTDVIATCAFGIDANSFVNENSDFRVAGRKIFSPSPVRLVQTLAYFFAPLAVKLFKFKFIEPSAAEFLRNVFMETIEKREKAKIRRHDLVDILIDLKNQETKDDEFKFYGDRLVAQAIIFFGAGHETTSSTIAFTMHELCINTDIQDRLRKEIVNSIEKHGGITYEAIQDMKYLQMVVSETLRKYPLTPFLNRECVEEYRLPETGLVIDQGTPVLIPQHGLHWDPKYFPNPEKYDPERFNDENRNNIPPYVYLPFGDGPRNCIGERFGLLSSKLGIIYILQHFVVERSPMTRDPLVFGPTPLLQAEGGIQVKLRQL